MFKERGSNSDCKSNNVKTINKEKFVKFIINIKITGPVYYSKCKRCVLRYMSLLWI